MMVLLPYVVPVETNVAEKMAKKCTYSYYLNVGNGIVLGSYLKRGIVATETIKLMVYTYFSIDMGVVKIPAAQ